MLCPLCKGRMELGKTALPFDIENGRVIVILNVPARVCEQCGEEYIDMEVARKVEKLLDQVQRDGVKMGFVEYGLVA